MSIFTLDERTKENLSRCVGLPFERITEMELDEEIDWASQRHGGKIKFPRGRGSSVGRRGNALLAKGKIRTMEDVDAKIDAVK